MKDKMYASSKTKSAQLARGEVTAGEHYHASAIADADADAVADLADGTAGGALLVDVVRTMSAPRSAAAAFGRQRDDGHHEQAGVGIPIAIVTPRDGRVVRADDVRW